jgi:hypothetical protein
VTLGNGDEKPRVIRVGGVGQVQRTLPAHHL